MDLGLYKGPQLKAWHRHGVFGDVGEAQPREHHALNPVIALAGVRPFQLNTPDPFTHIAQVFVVLAVRSSEVSLAVKILDADSIEPLEGMARADSNHEPLAVERQGVKPIVEIIRPAEDRDIDLPFRQ